MNEPDRAQGQQLMTGLIESLSRGVPAALTELLTLGRTLEKRAEDVPTYVDRPRTSDGPTEAICEWGTGWSGTGLPASPPP